MNNNYYTRAQKIVQLAVSKVPKVDIKRAKDRKNEIVEPEPTVIVFSQSENESVKDVFVTTSEPTISYNNCYSPKFDHDKTTQRNATEDHFDDNILMEELNKFDKATASSYSTADIENFSPVQLQDRTMISLEDVYTTDNFNPENSETTAVLNDLQGFNSVHSDDFQNYPTYEEGITSSSDSEIEGVAPPKRLHIMNEENDNVLMEIEENDDISHTAASIVKNFLEGLMQHIFSVIFKKASTVKLRMKNKQKRAKGEEYVDRKGNVRCARQMKGKCNGCRFECNLLSDSEREHIFEEFWKIGDHHVQSQYVTSLIEEKPVVLGVKNRRKKKTNLFFLKANNIKYRVCKFTFLATFGIGKRYVDILTTNATQSGTCSSDMRGKKEPANKSSKLDTQNLRNHILKFPSFESHYSRRDSKKKYLHPDLNIRKMYSLYTDECRAENRKTLCYTIYYNTFKTMNLSFKKPYNDTCRVCDELKIKLKNKNLVEDDRKRIELEKQHHLEKVDAAYKTKAVDKMTAKASEGSIVVKAFDLQKVLETPSLTTGTSFYKRQLSTYNLTTHDLATNQASSYLWYESIGGRGSDEVASILYKDIQNLSDDVEHLIYYSDNCTGQNHNFTLPLMYEIAIKSKPNLKTIEHKFLVVGHTHMECDSDHARIERAKPKDMEICIPRDWYTMIRMLKNRRGEPFFNVYEMKLSDFFDFKSLYNLKNSKYIKRQKFITNEPVEWSKSRWIKVEKDKPGIFSLSQQIDAPEFKELSIIRNVNSENKVELKIKNNTKIPISTKKYKNLIEMLELIPEEYHQFYRNLPHSNKALDWHVDFDD